MPVLGGASPSRDRRWAEAALGELVAIGSVTRYLYHNLPTHMSDHSMSIIALKTP